MSKTNRNEAIAKSKTNGKRRPWSDEHVRNLKAMAKRKTPTGKIARKLRRTAGATRQKAFSIGLSLNTR